jgi:hypothetical protein
MLNYALPETAKNGSSMMAFKGSVRVNLSGYQPEGLEILGAHEIMIVFSILLGCPSGISMD